MLPELRAGNASIRVLATHTVAELQDAAAPARLWLAVDAPRERTIAELVAARDGGPREARYGRLSSRLLAAGIDGLSLGSEAVKDVTGLDLRRALIGSRPIEWAIFRLHSRAAHTTFAELTGGDARAIARTLRADAAAPAALIVTDAQTLLISDDYPASEHDRREDFVARTGAEHGATVKAIDQDRWLEVCATLVGPRSRVSAANLDQFPYDVGRRLLFAPDLARRGPMAPAWLSDGVASVSR